MGVSKPSEYTPVRAKVLNEPVIILFQFVWFGYVCVKKVMQIWTSDEA